MLRQRLRTRTPPLAFVSRTLVGLLALALFWYGLMTVLLAVKVSPDTVDSISGYRTAYDFLADLGPGDISNRVRAIVAAGGILTFLLCAYLAWKELPRPYLARGDLELQIGERGETRMAPRAVERVAEAAARRHPAVTDAAGRFGDEEIALSVSARRARELGQTLPDVQHRVVAALEEHGLPRFPVDVTLTHFDSKQRRELT